MHKLRFLLLYCLRAVGIFALAKYLTRKRLRILCYHGFSVGDEYQVSPGMFMRAETFEQRMKILRRRGIAVITLEEAVRKLRNGTLSRAETVITLDDGWVSSVTVGAPILQRYGYPATIYVSTEHLEAGTEVFNVALYYMIRRSGRQALTLRELHPALDGEHLIGSDPLAATLSLIHKAERVPLAERQRLLNPIAEALGLQLDEVLRDGRFRLLSRTEMRQASRSGIDIQLHTHTHHLPADDFEAMAREVTTNGKLITEVTGVEPRHFCYPSGEYTQTQAEWLERLGIASATTCDPGLNDGRTPVMLLRRFLDSDNKSNLAFEAEICGVRELLRLLSLNGSDSRQPFARPAGSAASQ
jgi:peptidoglycan/xylan/chitin deacetylase (PgdA/CDA1 family)